MKPSVIFRLFSATLVALLIALGTVNRRPVLATTPDVLAFLFKVGSFGTGNGQFVFPLGVAVGPDDRVYVVDTKEWNPTLQMYTTESDRVQVFNPDGTFAFSFGGTGEGNGQLNYPQGLAVGANGRILVADTDNNRLQLFDPQGQHLQTFGSYGNFDPLDPVNLDPLTNNYIGPAPTLDQFSCPTRVAVRPGTLLGDPDDAAGRIAIVDQCNHRIVVLNSALEPLFAFGDFGTNGNALGEFEYPFGVGMDLDRIYVADPWNHRIQIFLQDGTPLSFFGSAGPENTPSDLQNPYDVQPDGQGHLIVVDSDRSRVLVLQVDPAAASQPPCSEVTTAYNAGRCAIVGSDGTVYDARVLGRHGEEDSEFIFPQAAAADSHGRVIVIDTDRHRFKVFQGARASVTTLSVNPAGPVQSGQDVTLGGVVSNDGAVDLTVTVAATPSLAGSLTALAPIVVPKGQTRPFSFTYTTNQTGSLTFGVTATGTTSTGGTVTTPTVTSDAVTVQAAPGPKMLAQIEATPAQIGPGGTLTVRLTLTNTGNVDLLNVVPSVDVSPASLVTAGDIPAVNATPLHPGDPRVFTYTYGYSGQVGTVTLIGGGSAEYQDLADPTGRGSIELTGAERPTATASLVSDAEPPITQLQASGTPGLAGWYRSNIDITLTATDNVAVKAIEYRSGGNQRVLGSTASFTIGLQGGATVLYFAEDTAGNTETPHQQDFHIDSIPPDVRGGGVTPGPNAAGWINQHPTVKFIGSDGGSGLASVTPDQVLPDGVNQTVVGTATDVAGNSASTSLTVSVDTKAPSVVCAPNVPANVLGWYTSQSTVTVTCTAVDQPLLSGIQRVSAVCPVTTGTTAPAHPGVPGVGPETASAFCTITAEGVWDVYGEARDVADNLTISAPIRIRIDRTPPTVVCGTASGGEIWPPNHKMVAWNALVTVTDTVSGNAGFTLTGYSSSEAANAKGDGNTSVDMTGWTIGTPDTAGFVRSERSGPGTGRIYRLYYVGADAAGNTASCTSVLTEVPHDQGKKK